MHAAARRSLILASKLPARLVAGRRYPPRTLRSFHSSPSTSLALFPWTGTSQNQDSHAERNEPPQSTAETPAGQEVSEVRDTGDATTESNRDNKDKTVTHGSASRRSIRGRKVEGIFPIVLPAWFLSRNVKLSPEDSAPLTEGMLNISHNVEFPAEHGEDADLAEYAPAGDLAPDLPEDPISQPDNCSISSGPISEQPLYSLSHALLSEITASMSAGFSLSRTTPESFPATKSHLKLHCPVNGGIFFLNKIVEEVASDLKADVIKIDAQDLAEIASDYIREGPDATSNSIWTLGYDVNNLLSRSTEAETDETDEEAEEETTEDDEKDGSRSTPNQFSMTAIPIAVSHDLKNIGDIFKKLRDQRQAGAFFGRSTFENGPRNGGRGNGNGPAVFTQAQGSAVQWNELKLTTMLESLLDANQTKRHNLNVTYNEVKSSQGIPLNNGQQAGQVGSAEGEHQQVSDQANALSSASITTQSSPSQQSTPPLPRTVVLIRDFKELSATLQGGQILEKLLDLVQKRRRECQEIMIVGTTASADLTPEISKAAIDSLQSAGSESSYRTLFVTPDRAGPSGGLFFRDEERHIRDINVRNVLSMVRRLYPTASRNLTAGELLNFASELHSGLENPVENGNSLATWLDGQVLSVDEVHRIVFTAVGGLKNEEQLGSKHIDSAMKLLEDSDEVKAEWADNERQLINPTVVTERTKSSPSDARLKRLRKTCNHHEKVLLRGVVNPESIRATFNDVHAPPETIEALKTLTTLSLTRPDAFRYGVLATDRISGLLLYGPPGTGKTLLAKAVAKESGATVLEISGSDVYDMYVGESEKNVRAIFSLAKKLSPCVVFIDEADAIFASRGSGTNRNSHRELINQFLREWDGMSETTAFIMVATNRPFDLDDAALRRLPRRLLVDLPTEKDREAILGIHLKDEQVDASVSLARLAVDTPLYSGSDLKNLAVAAALACVREENDAKAKHTGDEPFEFPEKRILEQRHFNKAMEEISASVSEDMSTLSAIRKFDEKYGDRRGRRKKMNYGFTPELGNREDSAKVRL